MPTTPNYQGMFLRGVGSQNFAQNNGSKVGVTTTIHSSAGLGEIQGDAVRDWFFLQKNPGGYGTLEGIGRWDGWGGSGPDGGGGAWNSARYKQSNMVPTSNEIRPVNVAVKYIIKAE